MQVSTLCCDRSLTIPRAMIVAPDTRLGPYEILSRIGAGGMGEVFRARDTRLDRIVAIKVLPPHLSGNPQLRERFDREARAISSLSHPNICTLFDVGHDQGIDYLVMEFLEGESLADRLGRGPLPIEQVVRHGAQIADALATAHKRGIVHRDLKPGNVMLTKSGAKLLDFGLAKSLTGVAGGPEAATEQQKPLTEEGTILGTFQYMAPEQLEGIEADPRTDIFALGVLLYEMATGQRAFAGKTRTSLIASIVGGEPRPIQELQPLAPSAFAHLVQQCLRKDPDDRWQSAQDVAGQLRWVEATGSATVTPLKKRSRPQTWLLVGVTAALLIASGLLLARLLHREPLQSRVELDIEPLPDTKFNAIDGAVIVSPDGQNIAAKIDSVGTLVRNLASRELRIVRHSGYDLFWSADSRSIGYFDKGKLKRVDLSGGSPRTIAAVGDSRGAAWGRSGVILFAFGADGGLSRVSENGGPVTPVTTIDPARELGHWRPHFFPDGEHFVYFSRGRKSGTSAVYVGSLGSKKTTLLLKSETAPVLAPPDILLYLSESSLLAQRIDTKEWRLQGTPTVVAEQVEYAPAYGALAASASASGVFAYQERTAPARTAIVQLDRSGKEIARLIEDGGSNIDLSKDGRKLAYQRSDAGSRSFDLWTLDLVKGGTSRLTFDPSSDQGPVWSPDGSQIAFGSDRAAGIGLYVRSASGTESLLFETSLTGEPVDWSRDGRFLLMEPGGGNDLLLLPLTGRVRTPIPFAVNPAMSEHTGRFSPDGRFAVYASNETGRHEIYVQPVPPTGAKWQVSTEGGNVPRWRGDGKEILYLSEKHLSAVTVSTSPGFESSAPRELFPLTDFDYVVSPDGSAIYRSRAAEARALPIRVVLHWTLPDR